MSKDLFGNILDQKQKDFIKQTMMETSPKPVSIPRKLYHATPHTNFKSIMSKGLQPHEIFGEIYFCEKESQVLKFVPRPCVIFCVETKHLDPQYLFISKDHKKTRGMEFEAFTYYKPIEQQHLQFRFKGAK